MRVLLVGRVTGPTPQGALSTGGAALSSSGRSAGHSPIAQLAERSTVNRNVPGSSPDGGARARAHVAGAARADARGRCLPPRSPGLRPPATAELNRRASVPAWSSPCAVCSWCSWAASRCSRLSGYLLKAQCIGHYNERRDSHLCSNDIQVLYSVRGMHEHPFPYVNGDLVDGQLTGGALEYPVLTGLFAWVPALFVGQRRRLPPADGAAARCRSRSSRCGCCPGWSGGGR